MKRIVEVLLIVGIIGGCGSNRSTIETRSSATTSSTATLPQPGVSSQSQRFTAEIWADNWFALYVNDQKVGEDSVPITTERSFNSETISFLASLPLTVGILAKDFIENESGLEYIGTDRQQMGDGGIVIQIRDESNRVLAVSDRSWKTFVTQEAPLNPACESSPEPMTDCQFLSVKEPDGWQSAEFDDTSWPPASVFTAETVGPKDGYSDIAWDPAAEFIWGPDLKTSNVVLLRKIVSGA